MSVASINDAVAALPPDDRVELPAILLETNGSPAERSAVLHVMAEVISNPKLGFYVEIWSYTKITFSGNGFYGGCGEVWLSPDAFDGMLWPGWTTAHDVRGLLVHESFHSFNCINHGPNGALNEGSAIWVHEAAFPTDAKPNASLAEATYGTKLYYRDIWNPPQPDYPLEAATAPTQKFVDVMTWLSDEDPSKLPWNSTYRLQGCFKRYWESLDRNVDFYGVWLPAAAAATQRMLADPECRPLTGPPPPSERVSTTINASLTVVGRGTVSGCRATLAAGTRFGFRFTFVPTLEGRTLEIWRRIGTGPWKLWTTRVPGPSGAVGSYLTARSTVSYRARFAGDSTARGAWSAVCTVKVRP